MIKSMLLTFKHTRSGASIKIQCSMLSTPIGIRWCLYIHVAMILECLCFCNNFCRAGFLHQARSDGRQRSHMTAIFSSDCCRIKKAAGWPFLARWSTFQGQLSVKKIFTSEKLRQMEPSEEYGACFHIFWGGRKRSNYWKRSSQTQSSKAASIDSKYEEQLDWTFWNELLHSDCTLHRAA